MMVVYLADIPAPSIRYFNQTLDHFNFYTTPATFSQRYFVVDTFYKPGFVLFKVYLRTPLAPANEIPTML
jgi:hypothetical protein